jgi:hypothetical protein
MPATRKLKMLGKFGGHIERRFAEKPAAVPAGRRLYRRPLPDGTAVWAYDEPFRAGEFREFAEDEFAVCDTLVAQGKAEEVVAPAGPPQPAPAAAPARPAAAPAVTPSPTPASS